MCVLIFSTISVWNVSHSKKNWSRYDQKCVLVFTRSSPVQWEPSCFMRTEIIVSFRNLANGPNKVDNISICVIQSQIRI
jgi:hypothetical protein